MLLLFTAKNKFLNLGVADNDTFFVEIGPKKHF